MTIFPIGPLRGQSGRGMLKANWSAFVDLQIMKLNRTLRGWTNYFEVGTVTKAYRASNASGRIGHVPARSTTGPTREKECLQRTDLMETFGVA